MRGAWRRAASMAAAAVCLGACSSQPSCAPVPPSPDCADLMFGGVGYDEWRESEESRITGLQEVGNATYPACNVAEGCPGSELGGLGATDVWVIPGMDYADAVIGKRQNSDVLVIFVRIGVDPGEALPGTASSSSAQRLQPVGRSRDPRQA